MSRPSSSEVSLLLQIASLKAEKARAEIAVLQRRVRAIRRDLSDLSVTPTLEDAGATVAFGNWLEWRHQRTASINRDLALALAELSVLKRRSSRVIAREEVLKDLFLEAQSTERRSHAQRE